MPTLRSRRHIHPSKLSPSPDPESDPDPSSPPLSTPPAPLTSSSLLSPSPSPSPPPVSAPNPCYQLRRRTRKVHPATCSSSPKRLLPLPVPVEPQRGSHKRNKRQFLPLHPPLPPMPVEPQRGSRKRNKCQFPSLPPPPPPPLLPHPPKASEMAVLENFDAVFSDNSSSDDDSSSSSSSGNSGGSSWGRQENGNGNGCFEYSRVNGNGNGNNIGASGSGSMQGAAVALAGTRGSRVRNPVVVGGGGDVPMNEATEDDAVFRGQILVDLSGNSGFTPLATPTSPPPHPPFLSSALLGQTSSGQAQQPLVPGGIPPWQHVVYPPGYPASRLGQGDPWAALCQPSLNMPLNTDLSRHWPSSSHTAQHAPVFLVEQNGTAERSGQQAPVMGPSFAPLSQLMAQMDAQHRASQQFQRDHSRQLSSSRNEPLETPGRQAPGLDRPSASLSLSGQPSSSYGLFPLAGQNAQVVRSGRQAPVPGGISSAPSLSGQPSSSSNGPVPLVDQNAPGERSGRQEAARVRNLEIARRRAEHFAYFDGEGDEPPSAPPLSRKRQRASAPLAPQPWQEGEEEEDWPGPFSTARRLIKDRALAAAAAAKKWAAQLPPSSDPDINWTPRKSGKRAIRVLPMLSELCVKVLSQHAQSIESLDGIPDAAKVRISEALCARRHMSAEALALFFDHEPTEIRSRDCTQVDEEQLTRMMNTCRPSRLVILELGNCGRCLTDECIITTFGKAPGYLSSLHTLSLRGNYRISDRGLEAFVRAAPLLETLDLNQCSYISDSSMSIVADCAGDTLKSLCLDGCTRLNASSMLPSLVRMKRLQRLSLAQVEGVCDEIVSELMVNLGCNLMELSLAHCKALTDVAIAAIGACCPQLRSLKLDFLVLLTDVAIGSIVDGCHSLQTLSLTRCKFSDEAIATYVNTSGSCICDFSLNSVRKAGDLTLVALANHAKDNLRSLDASWCRQMNNKALGYLADACPNLHKLSLYGCTQVTDEFLLGHSNPNLEVIGLKL